MTSAPMPAAWASPMAFMSRPATTAQSASAFLTTPRPSPPIPSPPGGNGRGHLAMAAPPNFWFWPTPAAATVALPGSGRSNSRLKYAIPSGSPLPSLTTPPARLQVESHRAPAILGDLQKLGGRAPRQLRKDAPIHSHDQHAYRLGRDRLS